MDDNDDNVFLEPGSADANPLSAERSQLAGVLKSARLSSSSGGTSPRRVTFNKAGNDIQFFDFETPVTEIRRTNSDSSEHYSALRRSFVDSSSRSARNITATTKKSPLSTSWSDEPSITINPLDLLLMHTHAAMTGAVEEETPPEEETSPVSPRRSGRTMSDSRDDRPSLHHHSHVHLEPSHQGLPNRKQRASIAVAPSSLSPKKQPSWVSKDRVTLV